MDLSLVPKLAALLIPLAGIALPVIIILVVLHYRQQQREKLYEIVKHFADRGLPVPRELLDPPRPARGQDVLGNARFRALTLIGTGVGVALMFWLLDLAFLTGIGALLVSIGVAQWIAVRLDRGDQPAAPPATHDGLPR